MSTRTCKHCEKVKPISDFPLAPGCVNGRSPACRTCKYARRSKTAALANHLQKLYGLSLIDYRLLQWAQNDCCAVCHEPESDTNNGTVKRLAVDHCHKTGEVRGLLCSKCNRALGLMNDDVERLKSGIKYLGGIAL